MNDTNDWTEIKGLLDFAEKLKLKSDRVKTSMFLLHSFKGFLFLNYVVLAICIFNNVKISFVLVQLSTASMGFLFIVIENLLRRIKKNSMNDSKILVAIINLLRENEISTTEDFTELQKIQFELRLSRLDIKEI
jgi:CRISPR/Cas system endoribonuclease Cas6 (RAMP superfamily)